MLSGTNTPTYFAEALSCFMLHFMLHHYMGGLRTSLTNIRLTYNTSQGQTCLGAELIKSSLGQTHFQVRTGPRKTNGGGLTPSVQTVRSLLRFLWPVKNRMDEHPIWWTVLLPFLPRSVTKGKKSFIKSNKFQLYQMENKMHLWRLDTQRNDTKHSDAPHNDTQHYDIKHNDTQHNNKKFNTQRNDTRNCWSVCQYAECRK